MTIQDIPALNAVLNGLATVLMTAGFIFIKSGNREAHRKMMLSAGFVSAIFLVGYVSHKILVRGVHTPFGGEGAFVGLEGLVFALGLGEGAAQGEPRARPRSDWQ